jgi:hypothetical protein
MPIRRSRAILLASTLLAIGGAGGCWYPGYTAGGQGASRDLYTYESTPDFPQNVTVIDWTTSETLLTVEVPVGQQLVIRFYDDYNKDNKERPALMRWKLMPLGTKFGELDNSAPVPAYTHRRIDTAIRTKSESVPKPLPAPEPVSTR